MSFFIIKEYLITQNILNELVLLIYNIIISNEIKIYTLCNHTLIVNNNNNKIYAFGPHQIVYTIPYKHINYAIGDDSYMNNNITSISCTEKYWLLLSENKLYLMDYGIKKHKCVDKIDIGECKIINASSGGSFVLVLTDNGLYYIFLYNDILSIIGRPKKLDILGKIISISCSLNHAIIQTDDGLYGLGNIYDGKRLSGIKNIVPIKINFFNNMKIILISCGSRHTLILTNNGLYSFGCNNTGQLGLGDTIERNTPSKIIFFDGMDIYSISSGGNHTMILTNKGLYGFGSNIYNQIMSNNTHEIKTPTIIYFFHYMKIYSIVCGQYHTIISTNKGVYSFGCNDDAQLCLNDSLSRIEPTKIDIF